MATTTTNPNSVENSARNEPFPADGYRRREDYSSYNHPADRFFVPLLRDLIDGGLRRHATGGGKALDVGCGGQPLRGALERAGYVYTGVDVNQNHAGTVEILAAIDQPLADDLRARGPFDFILCTEVLEHVFDWRRAFENMGALLAPGGKLLVTCPHFCPPHEEPYDFWRPTTNALARFGEAVGLRPVEVVRGGDAWDVLGVLLATTPVESVGRGSVDRLLAGVGWFVRKGFVLALRQRWLRRRVRLAGPLHLSVYAVYEKPR